MTTIVVITTMRLVLHFKSQGSIIGVLQEYGLYYDGTSGTYLKYNQDTQTYDFHSQVAKAVLEEKPEKNNVKSKRKSSFKNDKKIPKVLNLFIFFDFLICCVICLFQVNSFSNMETLTSSFTNLNISNLHKLGLGRHDK